MYRPIQNSFYMKMKTITCLSSRCISGSSSGGGVAARVCQQHRRFHNNKINAWDLYDFIVDVSFQTHVYGTENAKNVDQILSPSSFFKTAAAASFNKYWQVVHCCELQCFFFFISNYFCSGHKNERMDVSICWLLIFVSFLLFFFQAPQKDKCSLITFCVTAVQGRH